MKILYMTIAYSQDGNGLYQNLVESLLNRGHEVTIVRSKHDIANTMYEKITESFQILSVKTGDPFSKNLIKKGLNQIMLGKTFKKGIKEYLSNEAFDLIIYATPPITLASVVEYCKKKYNAKTFLMLKDIFPQNAVDLGMMKENSLIYNYFKREEKKYYTYSDYIGCMSQGNVDYILKHNKDIVSSKVGVFANSIKIEEIDGLSFHDKETVFMFGGNLGKPQNIEYLLKIIEKAQAIDNAKFLIVGKGSEQDKIQEFIKNNKLNNLIYKSFVPQDEYYELLKSVDVGLISLDYRFTIPNIPSKFQHYLKLKKPVLAITDINTDIRNMIEDNNCGWWCPANDEELIIETIKSICDDKNQQKQKGENGFNYLVNTFDVEDNVDQIEKFMNKKYIDMKMKGNYQNII